MALASWIFDDTLRHKHLTPATRFSLWSKEEGVSKTEFFEMLAQLSNDTTASSHKAYGFEYMPITEELWLKATKNAQGYEALHLLHVPKNHQRVVLRVAYDGTLFDGFQRQKNGLRTVQGELESALSHLHPHTVKIHPASRTDKGVHAQGQTIHFDTDHPHRHETYLEVLPRLLPNDIQVMDVYRVPPVFHARYDVQLKTYRYRINQHPPIHRVHHVAQLKHPELDTLNERLSLFVGTHDFKNFVKLKGAFSTTRTLTKAEAYRDGDDVVIEIQGKSFVRYMVRMLIGAVVKYDKDTLQKALEDPHRAFPKHLAPAHALTLYDIHYRQA